MLAMTNCFGKKVLISMRKPTITLELRRDEGFGGIADCQGPCAASFPAVRQARDQREEIGRLCKTESRP